MAGKDSKAGLRTGVVQNLRQQGQSCMRFEVGGADSLECRKLACNCIVKGGDELLTLPLLMRQLRLLRSNDFLECRDFSNSGGKPIILAQTIVQHHADVTASKCLGHFILRLRYSLNPVLVLAPAPAIPGTAERTPLGLDLYPFSRSHVQPCLLPVL